MGLKRAVLIIVAIAIVFGGGFFSRAALGSSSPAQAQAKQHPLLAKRVFMDNPNDPIINFQPLRASLNSYFTKNGLSGSLYFEYLPTGTSIRINGEVKEVAASLMKLPAAMDAYKAAELGKVKLDTVITLQEGWLDDAYGDLYKKGAGYQLTLEEAIKIMLEQSDNTALKAVSVTTFGLIKPTESVLNAVDVDFSQNPDLTVSIGARSYGSFLKCLYFACYDNEADSQQILKYLSQTNFNDRLVAGIPTAHHVPIAHKIGVHTDVQSDCGIVYLPNRNYLLCIMLKGGASKATDQQIADMSKLAYQYLEHK